MNAKKINHLSMFLHTSTLYRNLVIFLKFCRIMAIRKSQKALILALLFSNSYFWLCIASVKKADFGGKLFRDLSFHFLNKWVIA